MADHGLDATLYDDSHSFVFEHGTDVIDLLDPTEGERILDLGCGTGHLTHELVDRGVDAVGVDADAEMVAAARERYPSISVRQQDARDLAVDDPFDAVFSNAALHWVPEQDTVAERVFDALRPGGRFVAEMGGVGNVAAVLGGLTDALDAAGHPVTDPWYFPTIGEQATCLEDAGFVVRYATLFDRPTPLSGPDGLRNWYDMFAGAYFRDLNEDEREQVVATAEDRLRPTLYDAEADEWGSVYVRLRFVATRPD